MRTSGSSPELGLADAGYRSERNLKVSPIELAVALGREGKRHAQIDADTHPYTAAMAAALHTQAGKAAYRKRNGSASRPTSGSSRCWGFASSACVGCTGRGRSGSWCVWR